MTYLISAATSGCENKLSTTSAFHLVWISTYVHSSLKQWWLTCTLWQVHYWRCGLRRGWRSHCHSCFHSCTGWACGPGTGYHGFAVLRGSETHPHCPPHSCKHHTALWNHHQRDPLSYLTDDKGESKCHVVTFCVHSQSHFNSLSSLPEGEKTRWILCCVKQRRCSFPLTLMGLNKDGKNSLM